MGSLVFNNKTIEKYFGILKNLDLDSKKNLIIKLTESISADKKLQAKLDDIFGAWQDTRTADEIIREIETSRFNKRELENF